MSNSRRLRRRFRGDQLAGLAVTTSAAVERAAADAGTDTTGAGEHWVAQRLTEDVTRRLYAGTTTPCPHLDRDSPAAMHWCALAPDTLMCTGCVNTWAAANPTGGTCDGGCGATTDLAPVLLAAGPVTIIGAACRTCLDSEGPTG